MSEWYESYMREQEAERADLDRVAEVIRQHEERVSTVKWGILIAIVIGVLAVAVALYLRLSSDELGAITGPLGGRVADRQLHLR